MNKETLSTIADSSNLLLGLERKMSKLQAEATPMQSFSPIPGNVSEFGETTREKRNVMFSDGGRGFSNARFESERQYVHVPVCDQFDTFGTSSRLVGRNPMIRKF